VAGALIAAAEDEVLGWVHTIGVRRPWRGRGIGESLLRHSLAAFAARGLTKAGLGVDSENETGATRLYERVGMRVSRRYDSFRKVLPAPRA
jgi:mycothiol synthase